MEKQQHTPGPWSYENEEQSVYVGDQIEGQWIAQVRGWGWLQKLKNGEAVQDANGRLIAAAPELLEAHEPERGGADFLDWIADRLVHIYGESENIDFVICLRRRAAKARAAIAKATGGDAA